MILISRESSYTIFLFDVIVIIIKQQSYSFSNIIKFCQRIQDLIRKHMRFFLKNDLTSIKKKICQTSQITGTESLIRSSIKKKYLLYNNLTFKLVYRTSERRSKKQNKAKKKNSNSTLSLQILVFLLWKRLNWKTI